MSHSISLNILSSYSFKGGIIMEIKNCTPHEINVVREDGTVLSIPASGIIPRCSQSEEKIMSLEGIAITRQTFGDAVNLPPETPGVFLVVSRMVAAAVPGRKDLLVPGPLVRDENGQPCGCRGLSVVD